MWRILAVEEIYGCEVYTVANVSSPAARYSDNRHFQCDWNGRHLCNELEGHVFGQIFVDFFGYNPDGRKLVLRVASLPIPSLVLQPEIF
jgi:hypothetical protein